jgi:hypothetical protein
MNRQNYKVLVWLVIILLILNISTLGTILWFRIQNNNRPYKTCQAGDKVQKMKMHDAFVKEELGFNEDQMKKFTVLRDKHIREIELIKGEIEKTRKLQFESIRDTSAGPAFIDSLNRKIGELHMVWARNSTEFLRQSGSFCTPDQRVRMFDMLERSRKDNLQWPDHKCRQKPGHGCQASGKGN